jgi:hypothetical protein
VLRFPIPAALHGDALTAELVAAGFRNARVYADEDELVVSDVEQADRRAVQRVVDAHVPPPRRELVPPLTDDEITRVRAMLANRR